MLSGPSLGWEMGLVKEIFLFESQIPAVLEACIAAIKPLLQELPVMCPLVIPAECWTVDILDCRVDAPVSDAMANVSRSANTSGQKASVYAAWDIPLPTPTPDPEAPGHKDPQLSTTRGGDDKQWPVQPSGESNRQLSHSEAWDYVARLLDDHGQDAPTVNFNDLGRQPESLDTAAPRDFVSPQPERASKDGKSQTRLESIFEIPETPVANAGAPEKFNVGDCVVSRHGNIKVLKNFLGPFTLGQPVSQLGGSCLVYYPNDGNTYSVDCGCIALCSEEQKKLLEPFFSGQQVRLLEVGDQVRVRSSRSSRRPASQVNEDEVYKVTGLSPTGKYYILSDSERRRRILRSNLELVKPISVTEPDASLVAVGTKRRPDSGSEEKSKTPKL